ncbi:excalibur calcium-binding domain-containing protein [Streptomyces sp. NPDC041003]|uniref:excalibur calcium-binding domain-containing protein n=1 Tax=Streptomyces sp. NPDC041003 TaxID=3155730 RepID=UPI00340CBCAA
MARWEKVGKAVTVVLASIWFVVLVAADPSPKHAPDDSKSGPRPAVTVTVTASAPVPPASGPAPSTTPAPASTAPIPVATPTPPTQTAPAPNPAPAQPQGRDAGRPRLPAADDEKPRIPNSTSPAGGSVAGDSSTTGEGGTVSYRNCTAVRDAGAAPIRRGDPGYGRHLDRDGDGVACE